MTLKEFFTEHPRAALALSGGVDSAYLLYAAKEAGADVRAYFMSSAFQPEFELEDARTAAREAGAELRILDCDVLAVPFVKENPPDRCCLCKRAMFTALRDAAARDGYTLLLDGTNATDVAEDRPGMIALREIGVRSPLRECGLGKSEIRALAREAGLSVWDKPSYSCLATRIAPGERLSPERLALVEKAENLLFAMGFSDFRVRVSGETAKLQFTAPQMERAFEMRDEILCKLSALFDGVTLDLNAREETA